MMGMQPKSILTVFVVYFGLASVQPYRYTTDQTISSQVNYGNRIQEKFQNLFNFMVKNDMKKDEIYHGFLKQETIRKQAFDEMKGELQLAQNKNVYKMRNSHINEYITAKKREADKDKAETDDYNFDNVTYTFPEIRTQDAFHQTLKLLKSQKEHYDRVNKTYIKLKKTIDNLGVNSPRSNVEFMNDLNGTLVWLGSIINMDTDLVKKFIFGDVKPDDDDMKIPWRDASSSVVMFHWKSIKKYSSGLKGDDDVMEIRGHLMRMADLALKEVNGYKKYLEKVLPVFTAAPKYEIFVTNGTNSWRKMR